MSISFEKNKTKLLEAWTTVLNEKNSINWALFGYEGQQNDLKVVATGDGGLEELIEDLNSGKIMYAFVKLIDPKTSLNKFLLINWQGEGAPVVRKGTCANHIHDVAKFFSGAHLTINARTEDDIDQEKILKNLGSSAYNFKERMTHEEQKTPIGTNYSRVIPAKELNTVEMQNFWKKEEAEEKIRIEAEKERNMLELRKLEEEQRLREEKEHHLREQKIINNEKLQPAHKPIKTSPQPLSPEKTLSTTTSNRTVTEAERMRQERNQEARELIGGRVGTAKAIFTQNSTEGQLHNKNAPVKPVRNSLAQRINAINNGQQNDEKSSNTQVKEKISSVAIKPTENNNQQNDESKQKSSAIIISDDEDQFSTIKRSPHSKSNSLASPDDNKMSGDHEDDHPKHNIEIPANNGKSNIDDPVIEDLIDDGINLKARALYDYQAADESEITFDPGDIITHIDKIDEGWWQGLGPDGTYGLFPANYVELIN